MAIHFGTLNWCERTGGRLNSEEKTALARNVASMRAEMAFDEARTRLGLLHPAAIDIDSLTPPDSKLVHDADELARSAYNDVLWAHCLRTYYFGVLVAQFDSLKSDRELFYAAAICHDVGIGVAGERSVAGCCFAHSGGDVTAAYLSSKGHVESARRIGDAIATHMNLHVPSDQFSPESTLVAIGATCDIFGAYARRIHKSSLARTAQRWPREGLFEAFGPFLSQPHLKDSRTATLIQMGAFESPGVHPIESILAER